MGETRRWLLSACAVLALVGGACTSSDESASVEPVGADDDAEQVSETSSTTTTEVTQASTTTASTEAPPQLPTFDPPVIDGTPLSDDEANRSGTLSNGLTYYVRSNDNPGSSVSLRLAVKAGGIHEDPIGTGTAHFLEHMMFNGTEKFPGNSLDAALRRIGAEIGPDFNAYTNPTETVYQIQVEDRNDNVEVALDVLREWASAATLDPDEVAAEEPVVREELRVRYESGDGLIRQAFEDAYYLGTPFEGVSVAGTAATVDAMTPQSLREYYDTWYRPDNMAIVAVGDRSLDDLERLIIERFEDLEPRGERRDAPSTTLEELRQEPYVDVLVEPSQADSYISVDIPIRSWDRSTIGGNQQTLLEGMLGFMMNNRLSEGVDSGRLDLRRAGGGWFQYNAELAFLGFNLDADDLVAGTEEFMAELNASLQNPFTQSELDRARDAFRSSIEQQVAQFDSTQDATFADSFVRDFVSGHDLRSIEDRSSESLDFLNSLELDPVNNHWGWMVTSAAPMVIVVGPDAERTGSVEEHAAAIERASRSVADSFVDDVEEIDDLLADPAPVSPIDQGNLQVLEGSKWVFENGTTVVFAESEIVEEQVFVVSASPGGRAMLSDDDGALAPVAVDVVAASGAGEWDPIQMRRFLADVELRLTPYIADFAEGVSANSASDDVEVLFELIHLQLTAPRADAVPLRQQVEFARDQVERAELDSGTAATVVAQDARTGGGRFAARPTLEALDDLSDDRVLDIWNDRFGSLDDHVFVVVGDIDADRVGELAERWIGTLPPTSATDDPEQPARPGIIDERIGVGSGTATGAYRLIHVGESDETIRNQVLAELSTRILNDRIFTVIRESLGATYGGFAAIEFSDPGDEVELFVSIDGDPERISEIANSVSLELATLLAGGVTEDDFDEAVSVLESEYNFISNANIIEALFDEALEPRDRIITRQAQWENLQQLTRGDVSAFLADVISQTDRVDVRNIPSN